MTNNLEHQFIEWLESQRSSHPNCFGDLGHDAAVTKTNSDAIAISTDMFIEGLHFDLNYWPKPADIGYKAVIHAISDIFVTLAKPSKILVSSCFSQQSQFEFITACYAGIMEAAKEFNLEIVGGDFNFGADKTFLSITCFGQVSNSKGRLNCSRAGDRIYTTPDLGFPSVVLLGLMSKSQLPSKELNQFYRPIIETDIFTSLRSLSLGDHICITDNSDGLVRELKLIAAKSKVSIEVEEEFLNKLITESYLNLSIQMGCDPIDQILNGGESFKPLITSSKDLSSCGPRLLDIGQVIEMDSNPQVYLKHPDGAKSPL